MSHVLNEDAYWASVIVSPRLQRDDLVKMNALKQCCRQLNCCTQPVNVKTLFVIVRGNIMTKSKSSHLLPLIEPKHGCASGTNRSVPSTGNRPSISAAVSVQQLATSSKSRPTSQAKNAFGGNHSAPS